MGKVCYCLSSGFLKNNKAKSAALTDLSLLIFKHGDGWTGREGAGEDSGDGRADRRGEGMTKMAEERSGYDGEAGGV